MFYLNYVGCKVTNLRDRDANYESFTLTMWDVKEYMTRKIISLHEGFTLTMWDVKFTNASPYKMNLSVLP